MASPVLTDPDLRTAAVRQLTTQTSADGEAGLCALGGIDLCVLGGPRHAVFPQPLAEAWLGMKEADRDELIGSRTARLVRDGKLIPQPGKGNRPEYGMSPELGVVLAARSRPAYVVVAAAEGHILPPLSLFALARQEDHDPLLVAEFLASPGTRDLGPVGCVYSYMLVTVSRAAALLAELALTAPPKPRRWSRQPGYTVTRFHPEDSQQRIGRRISVRGDGATAQISGADPGSLEAELACDLGELETVMARLLTQEGQ